MFEITLTAQDLDDLRRQMSPFMEGKLSVDEIGLAREEAIIRSEKPKKTKAKQEPQPEPRNEDIPEGVLVHDVPEPQVEELEEKPQPVDAKARAAVDLLKLKNEQLDRLRELFRAGKGTFVRQLLQKYGQGAKVFPEVDAKHFPRIKQDIDQELN